MPDVATRIRQIGAVFVPVADQDRSLEFYVEKLGFEKRADVTDGGHHRWLELAPPGEAKTIAPVPPSEGESAGGDVARCAFATGVPRSGLVSIEVTIEDPVPAQFFFRDPDGNRFLIVQPD